MIDKTLSLKPPGMTEVEDDDINVPREKNFLALWLNRFTRLKSSLGSEQMRLERIPTHLEPSNAGWDTWVSAQVDPSHHSSSSLEKRDLPLDV
jgi:hypothetical protein